MATPIGISFMPSDENQALGPRRGQLEGQGGSDLAQAFKILSLRLPQVLGARSLAPQRLLSSPGSGALPPAFDPNSAIFRAMIEAMSGRSPYRDFSRNENPGVPSIPNYDPRIIPGEGGEGHYYTDNGLNLTAPGRTPTSFGAEDRFDRPRRI